MQHKGAMSLPDSLGQGAKAEDLPEAISGMFTSAMNSVFHGVEDAYDLAYDLVSMSMDTVVRQPMSYFYQGGVRMSRKMKNVVRDYRGDYSALLDEALALSDKYLDPKGGVVWKQVKGSGEEAKGCDGVEAFVAKEALSESQWPVIKASTILHGITPTQVSQLLMDSKRVTEYNEFAVRRTDLEVLRSPVKGVEEKIIYVQTRNPFKLKPYDMVSIMRSAPSPTKKGAMRIITKGCDHAKAPPNPGYRRSSVVVAVNECLPHRERGSKQVTGTRIITITQSRYIGIPKFFLNKMNTLGTLNYLAGLRRFVSANPKK
jgi:hypothetical protein